MIDPLDLLVPGRPRMPRVSRELHNSGRYSACLVSCGLVVQSHRTGTGRLLPDSHPQFADYLEAFDTAIDADESDALCRALINP